MGSGQNPWWSMKHLYTPVTHSLSHPVAENGKAFEDMENSKVKAEAGQEGDWIPESLPTRKTPGEPPHQEPLPWTGWKITYFVGPLKFGGSSELLVGFPCGKESTICQCWRHRFDPCITKIPWRREWQPTPLFLPGESHGQQSQTGYSPQGCKRVGCDLPTKQPQRDFSLPWLTVK